LALAATIGVAAAGAAEARISGPYQHENLSIFLVHDAGDAVKQSAVGRYMTLAEALATKAAVVFETGDVNQLEVQNLSKDRTLFIQASDIVKGGKQDRVLSVDLVLPPGSGRAPIAAFCVEQGRWSGRGDEAAESFASAEKSLAGRELKLAARAKRLQSDVWDAVAATQSSLATALGADVASPASPSSLQLTLESEKLAEAVTAHMAALEGLAEAHPDAVGYVYAINGRIAGGDIYASPDLFRRQWSRLLEASATEAVAERSAPVKGEQLAVADVDGFLHKMDAAEANSERLPAGVTLISREVKNAAAFETRADGLDGWIHRNYVVK
jgi:hypothetical protein